MSLSTALLRAVILSLYALVVRGHNHHAPNMNFDMGEPIDGVLKAHIILMSIAFGAL
ncbi:hypothetical protein LPJ71_006000, partial [Coemansia sp. S17]